MNEPPGARMRVGLSALTVAEYFREDLQQDVLLFIGYQPTLATEMVQAEERPVIASRRICGGLPLQLELATKAAAVSQIHIRATEMQAGVMSNPFTVGSVSYPRGSLIREFMKHWRPSSRLLGHQAGFLNNLGEVQSITAIISNTNLQVMLPR